MPDVALVTSEAGRRLDPDLPIAVDALAGLGVAAHVVLWDDPKAEWDGFNLAVVRSCWDYSWRRDEFLEWAAGVATLRNPEPVLRWNTDKRYLRDLERIGVPIVPTAWNPTGRDDLPDGGEWVVKPSVSAGSRDTARWADPAAVLKHARGLRAAGRTAMVQPYMSAVDAEGETALLFIGGEFSHAVRKGPLLVRGEGVRQDRDSRGDLQPVDPTSDQLEVARAVLAAAPRERELLLYARVDLVSGEDGRPLLLELELAEPSLFLPQAPAAGGRFARAVVQILDDCAVARG